MPQIDHPIALCAGPVNIFKKSGGNREASHIETIISPYVSKYKHKCRIEIFKKQKLSNKEILRLFWPILMNFGPHMKPTWQYLLVLI